MCSKMVPDANGLVKKTDYNTKITEIEGKIPSITSLDTTAALKTVNNKIPDISNLVTKTDYDAKIKDIESKYFTTYDYNKFMNEIVDNTIKEKGFVKKSDISEFISSSDLDKKIATSATKAESKAEQYKIVKV